MTELKIDEECIVGVVKTIDLIIEFLQNEKTILEDKERDIFMRFMSYHRLGCIVIAFNNTMNLFKHLIRCGHDITHDVLQTQFAIENGWGPKTDMDNNFFLHDKAENIQDLGDNIIAVNLDDLDDDMKEKLKQLVANKFKKETSH